MYGVGDVEGKTCVFGAGGQMKAFSQWLFKLCWRREIAVAISDRDYTSEQLGASYCEGFSAGTDNALWLLGLHKEPK